MKHAVDWLRNQGVTQGQNGAAIYSNGQPISFDGLAAILTMYADDKKAKP